MCMITIYLKINFEFVNICEKELEIFFWNANKFILSRDFVFVEKVFPYVTGMRNLENSQEDLRSDEFCKLYDFGENRVGSSARGSLLLGPQVTLLTTSKDIPDGAVSSSLSQQYSQNGADMSTAHDSPTMQASILTSHPWPNMSK